MKTLLIEGWELIEDGFDGCSWASVAMVASEDIADSWVAGNSYRSARLISKQELIFESTEELNAYLKAKKMHGVLLRLNPGERLTLGYPENLPSIIELMNQLLRTVGVKA